MPGKGEVMKEREPVQVIHNPRDDKGRKTDQVKSSWRKATHSRKEIPGAGDNKTRYRMVRRPGSMSLKEFARRQDDEHSQRWLHNKAANTANPPKGIGSTRKKKGSGGNQGPKNPTGKEKRGGR